MTITLVLSNVERLENGEAVRLVLDRHGALIGRSPHADWSLPDPKNYVSSTHCEIDYRDGVYVLIDKSTNGTFVNGAGERMSAPHVLAHGDEITVGHYRISVQTAGAPVERPAPNASGASGWGAWDSPAPSPGQAQAASGTGWDMAPAAAPAVGWHDAPGLAAAAASHAWTASDSPGAWGAPAPAGDSAWAAPASAAWSPSPPIPHAPPPPSPSVASAWGSLPTPGDAAPPMGWNDPAPESAISGRGAMAHSWAAPAVHSPPPPAADDVWAKFGASNSVDWSRGFGDAAASAAPAPAPAPPSSSPQGFDHVWQALLAAAGVQPSDVRARPETAAATAGALLKRLVGGLVMMVEARARAKAQLGAMSTALEFDGNNPLKFARSTDKALAQLLNPPERGFMPPERAVEDAFQDLQAHQMATLAAMQGALRSTLDRFSPEAIRGRAEHRGLLAKILPGARDAALWQAYEREFEGVARGSDEAFMDIFAKAFKQAYEQAAAEMKARR